MSWFFQPLPLAAPSGGPAIYSETGGAAFGSVASGADTLNSTGPTFTLVDAFNRASLGSDWSAPVDPSDTAPQITTNQFAGAGAGSYHSGWYNASTPGDGVGHAVTVGTLSDTVWILTRVSAPNTSGVGGYLAVVESDGSGRIERINNASYTTLVTWSAGAVSAGDAIAIIASGVGATVTVTAYRYSGGAWTQIVTYSDTSGSRITSTGFGGLGVYGSASRLDDFGTLELSGGAVYTETGSGVSGWVATAVDAATIPDTGAGIVGAGVGGGDAIFAADTGAGVGAWASSGDAFKVFGESGAAIMTGAAGGVDAGVGVDVGAAVGAWAIGGADVVVWVDAGADVFEGVSSGAESYTPGGGTVHNESGAAIFTMVAGGADVWVAADAGVATVAGAATGADAGVGVDAGAMVFSGAVSGAGSFVGADSGASTFGGQVNAADIGVGVDAGAAVFEMVASGDAFTPAVGYVKPVHVRGGGATAAQSTPRTRGGGVKVS